MVNNNPNIDELSFRQMVDGNYQTTHYCQEYLEQGHKGNWYYITQGDYNLYYAENEVYTNYEVIGNIHEPVGNSEQLEGEE